VLRVSDLTWRLLPCPRLLTTTHYLSLRAPTCRGAAISIVPTRPRDCFVAYGSSQRQVGVKIAEPVPKRSEESRDSQRRVGVSLRATCPPRLSPAKARRAGGRRERGNPIKQNPNVKIQMTIEIQIVECQTYPALSLGF
jgi:hypothetical protein